MFHIFPQNHLKLFLTPTLTVGGLGGGVVFNINSISYFLKIISNDFPACLFNYDKFTPFPHLDPLKFSSKFIPHPVGGPDPRESWDTVPPSSPHQASLKKKSVSGGAARCLKKGQLGTSFFHFCKNNFSPKIDNIYLQNKKC